MEVERLEEVIVSALLHGLDGGVRGLGHGDENDGDARVDLADSLVDLQAGLVWQMQIEENDIGRLGPDQVERCSAGFGNLDAVPGGWETLAHLLGDYNGVIVYEKQIRHVRSLSASGA